MTEHEFKGEVSLDAWLDRHHVDVIRTHVTGLGGEGIGKYCNRGKFLKLLPNGHGIGDLALAMDSGGTPHLTFWHPFRTDGLGDIALKPDLDTLISDGTDPNLGHCICEFAYPDGTPIPLDPRTMLRNVVAQVADAGFDVTATYELEFFLFENSFSDAKRRGYEQLTPVTASDLQTIYLLRNAYAAKPFMDKVVKRLDWFGIAWEGWNDENGVGQIELNLEPGHPIAVADAVVRTKQVIYEVAVDMGLSVTFMPQPLAGYSSGMHIHHSLTRNGESAFFSPGSEGNISPVMQSWVAGLIETMPAAVSYLCPTINAFRRLREFSAPPVTPTWGVDNRSTALRLVTRSPGSARIEHRLGSSDMNPYLGLAALLAGGLAGYRHSLTPPPEMKSLAWGLPDAYERLPNTITTAADTLQRDKLLREILGGEEVDYWVKSRKWEWFLFHTEGADPDSRSPTRWEYDHYFAIV